MDAARDRDREARVRDDIDARARASRSALGVVDVPDGEEARPVKVTRADREHWSESEVRGRGRAAPVREGTRPGEQGHPPPGLVPRADARDAVQEREQDAHLAADRHDVDRRGRVSPAEGARSAVPAGCVEVRASAPVGGALWSYSAWAHRHVQGSDAEGAGAARESRAHHDGRERAAQSLEPNATETSRARDHGARGIETTDSRKDGT